MGSSVFNTLKIYTVSDLLLGYDQGLPSELLARVAGSEIVKADYIVVALVIVVGYSISG